MILIKLLAILAAAISFPMTALLYAANEEGEITTKYDKFFYPFNKVLCLFIPTLASGLALLILTSL